MSRFRASDVEVSGLRCRGFGLQMPRERERERETTIPEYDPRSTGMIFDCDKKVNSVPGNSAGFPEVADAWYKSQMDAAL